MESRFALRLLLISVFSVVISNTVQNVAAAENVAPVGAPKSQPVAPSSNHDKVAPAPKAVTPVSHVSFPPSNAPSPSVKGFQSQDAGSQSSSSSSISKADTDSESQGGSASSLSSSSGLQFDGESPLNFDFNSSTVPPKLPKVLDAGPEVRRICLSTDDPELCLSSIVPFLHGGKTDIYSILELEIKVASNFAKVGLNALNKQSATPGNSEKVAAVINDCKDNYEDILYNFDNALTALPTRDMGTVNTMLTGVINSCGDCEDEFKSIQTPSPVSPIANQVINMTANAIAIGSLTIPKS